MRRTHGKWIFLTNIGLSLTNKDYEAMKQSGHRLKLENANAAQSQFGCKCSLWNNPISFSPLPASTAVNPAFILLSCYAFIISVSGD
jgi:hypothetical protein